MTEIFRASKPLLAVLVDPDHTSSPAYEQLLQYLHLGYADLILVGGSTSRKNNIDQVCKELKATVDVPVVLFPGNGFQLSQYADAIMTLSLISGRNPDYLIGRMVEAAPIIKSLGLSTIPTGYIMIGDNALSAASYMTGTQPIPSSQIDIAVQTALAGALLGMSAIYLEGGSGANLPINSEMVKSVRKVIDLPLIVGGGIKKEEQIEDLVQAGADVIVVGTALEESPQLLPQFKKALEEARHIHG